MQRDNRKFSIDDGYNPEAHHGSNSQVSKIVYTSIEFPKYQQLFNDMVSAMRPLLVLFHSFHFHSSRAIFESVLNNVRSIIHPKKMQFGLLFISYIIAAMFFEVLLLSSVVSNLSQCSQNTVQVPSTLKQAHGRGAKQLMELNSYQFKYFSYGYTLIQILILLESSQLVYSRIEL